MAGPSEGALKVVGVDREELVRSGRPHVPGERKAQGGSERRDCVREFVHQHVRRDAIERDDHATADGQPHAVGHEGGGDMVVR